MFSKKNAPQDCAEDTIAIAHDNDLKLVENVVRNKLNVELMPQVEQ